MKKFLAFFTVLLLAVSMIPAVSAGSGLPFELNAPENIAVSKTDGDSPTTMQFTFSVPNDMCDFLYRKEHSADLEAFFDDYSFSDLWVDIQVDWAIDDVDDPVSGWHFSEYWNGRDRFGFGYDEEGRIRVSDWDCVSGASVPAETVGNIWLTRGIPNDFRWNGDPEQGTPGVKDQLNPDQYTYDYDNEELYIDFTEHTMYMRARFAVTVRTESEDDVTDSFYYSGWSETVAYGKDAESAEIDLSVLKAPVIKGLRLLDDEFDGYPVAAYTLEVPDELSELLPRLTVAGGTVNIEVEARVGGGEWVELQGDWIITSGELTASLRNLAEAEGGIDTGAAIELRARYCVYGYGDDEYSTDWSNVITFGAGYCAETEPAGNEPAGNGSGDGVPVNTGCKCASIIWILVPIAALAVIKASMLLFKR